MTVDPATGFDPSLVVTVVLAIVGSGGVGALVKLWWDRRDGTEAKKVAEVERITKMWEKAEERAREAETRERKAREHASELRIWAMNTCGVTSEQLPDWPL